MNKKFYPLIFLYILIPLIHSAYPFEERKMEKITLPPEISALVKSMPFKDHPNNIQDWETFVFVDFEGGSIPSDWLVVENGSSGACWGIDQGGSHCQPYSGNYMVWCAAGCQNGRPSGGNHLDNQYTWMIYGPFSLDGTSAARFSFYLRVWFYFLNLSDYVFYGVSIDGNEFDGYSIDSSITSWQLQIHNMSQVIGEPLVWVGILFSSGLLGTDLGAFVDDIKIERYFNYTPTPTPSPTNTPTLTPSSTPSPTFTPTVTPTSTPLPPNAPTLLDEPEYTKGLFNTINWTDESSSGAIAYYAECSLNPNFGVIYANTGWISSLYATFSNLHHGYMYFYRVKAKNNWNQESPWSNVEHSTQDSIPPNTWILDMNEIYYTPDINIPFEAVEDTSGFAYVTLHYNKDFTQWRQYQGTYSISPITFRAWASGIYDFYTVGVDRAGNIEPYPIEPDARIQVNINTPTRTPTDTPTSTNTPTITNTPLPTNTPTFTLTPTETPNRPQPPVLADEPEFTAGTTNAIFWSDESEQGVVDYFAIARIGSSVVQESGWINSTTHTFANLQDGTLYTYQVKCRNASLAESLWSNATSSTQDNSNPISNITYPYPDAYLNGPVVEIKGTAYDAVSGVAKVEVSTDNGYSWVIASGTNSWYFLWTLPIDGLYTLSSRCTDKVGNMSTNPHKVNVIVDKTAPKILLGGYWDTRITTSIGGYLTLIAFIPSLDINKVEIMFQGSGTGLYLRDDGINDWAPNDGIYTFMASMGRGLPPLKMEIYLEARDRANNIGLWPYLIVK